MKCLLEELKNFDISNNERKCENAFENVKILQAVKIFEH